MTNAQYNKLSASARARILADAVAKNPNAAFLPLFASIPTRIAKGIDGRNPLSPIQQQMQYAPAPRAGGVKLIPRASPAFPRPSGNPFTDIKLGFHKR